MPSKKNRTLIRLAVEAHVDRWLAQHAVSVPVCQGVKTSGEDAWASYRDWLKALSAGTDNPVEQRLAQKANSRECFRAVMLNRFPTVHTPAVHYKGLLLPHVDVVGN